MPVQRIDSIYDTEAIKQEAAIVADSLSKNQQQIMDLYNSIQKYKGAGFSKASEDVKELSSNMEKSNVLTTQLTGTNRKLEESIKAVSKSTVSAKTTDKELADAKAKLIKAQSEQNVVLQGYKLQSAEATKAAKLEAKQALGLVDAYQQLTIEYNLAQREAKNLGVEAIRLAKAHGTESAQAKKAAADARLAATNALALNKQLQSVDKTVGQSFKNVGNYTSAFGKAFRVIRQAAYIIPGLGIAGIFGIIFESLAKLTSGLDLFSNKATIVTRVFKDTGQGADAMKDALSKLGDTAIEIADKAIENLDEAIIKLNDDLGLTPSVIEQAQAALKLLQQDAEDTEEVFRSLSENIPVDPSGLGLGTGPEQLRQLAKLEENKRKQAELQKKLNEEIRKQNTKDLQEDLKDQGRLNIKFTSDNLQLQIDANEKVVSNEKKSLGARLSALKENLGATIQLNTLQKDKDIFESNESEAKKALILEDYRFKNLKAQADYEARRNAITDKAADEALKKAEENAKRLFKALGEFRTQLSESEIRGFEEIVKDETIPPTFRIKALETLARAKEAIILESAKTEITISKATSAEALVINKKAETDIYLLKLETAKKIADLRKISADIDKKIQADIIQREKDSQAEILRIGEEANKKFNDNQAKAAGKRAQQRKEELEIYREIERQAADDVLTFIQTIQDARFTREKNQLQALQDIRDENYQREIENINNSSLSEQDKAAKIAVLTAQHDAQVAETARKEREINIRQAKFDKAVTIAKIIAETAAAVVHQLYSGDPYTAFARAIAAGALGAAQLAIAIATPIPTYEKGTKSSKAGWALTDEKGPETYIEPGGKTFLGNDSPTMRYLKAGTEIIPHNPMMQRRSFISADGILHMQKEKADYSNDNRNADRIVKAIRSTRVKQQPAAPDLGRIGYLLKNVYQ